MPPTGPWSSLREPALSLEATPPLATQALFRKIAAALPGMESLGGSKQEDLVDINLAPSSAAKAGGAGAASGCAC